MPDDLLNQWRAIGTQGAAARDAWTKRKAASASAKEFDDAIGGALPASLAPALIALKKKIQRGKARRRHPQISEKALDVINAELPPPSAARPT